MSNLNLHLVAPQIVLLVTALLMILMELIQRKRGGGGIIAESLCLTGLLASLFVSFCQWGGTVATAFDGRFVLDPTTVFFNILFTGIGIGTLLLAIPFLREEKLPRMEFLVLILFSVLGMMLMGGSGELITMFISLELLSMGLYVMAGYRGDCERSIEASLKYFLLGAFGSAILLMGMALHWGSTGTLHLSGAAAVSGEILSPTMATAGFWLIIAGLAFKISAVPFHFWTADVYEGSPVVVTAFMATGTKAAAMAVLLRLLMSDLAPQESWVPVLWLLAVITMSVGNLMAIVQANIKRMLAFSSIAHAGYLIVALTAAGTGASRALLFYLAAYTLMNLGAFAVVATVGRKGEKFQSIYDYSGLARKHPWLALAMTIFLFSLAGIPPMVGFVGKLFIFTEAVAAGLIGLVVIAVLNSLVSVYYYLRVIYLMYMKEEWEETPSFKVPITVSILLVLTFIFTIWLGIFPSGLLEIAGAASNPF
jgi:NADH-quinone oxidoreductase subunit N